MHAGNSIKFEPVTVNHVGFDICRKKLSEPKVKLVVEG